MFGLDKNAIVDGLYNIARGVCEYTMEGKELAKRCDCKFGIKELKKSYTNDELTGCPEIRISMLLLSTMTDEEYKNLCKRAGIHIL